ncbi:hypothetical protein OROMI_018991 [Orobanche minor]
MGKGGRHSTWSEILRGKSSGNGRGVGDRKRKDLFVGANNDEFINTRHFDYIFIL